ncbi:MAG: hypothetical protein R2856_32105 [Caldilineaceae bacterium]
MREPGKSFADAKILINGGKAVSHHCADFYCALGANKNNIVMYDSRGVIYKGAPTT